MENTATQQRIKAIESETAELNKLNERVEIAAAKLNTLKLKAEMADLFILINQAETAKNQAAARINQIQAELQK